MADDLVLPSPEGEDNPADTPRFWAPPDAPTSGAPTRSVGGAMGPAVPQPYDGGSFKDSVRSAWDHSVAGRVSFADDLRALHDQPTSVPASTTFVDPMGAGGGLPGGEAPAAPSEAEVANRKAEAQDNLFAHLADEISPTSQGPQNLAGAVVGSMGSPESWGGLSSLLVSKLPMLASRPVLTGSLDAAITNALGDVMGQGVSLASGEQAEFEPTSVATSAALGAVIGAAVGKVHGTLSHETPAGAPEAQPPKAAETPAGGQADSAAPTIAPEAPAPASEAPRFAGEPLPDKGLAPANLAADGTIYVGPKGGVHFQIAEKHDFAARGAWADTGFVTPDGQFLNREHALEWVKSNEKADFRPSENVDGQLDAVDYREQVPERLRSAAAPRTISETLPEITAPDHVPAEPYEIAGPYSVGLKASGAEADNVKRAWREATPIKTLDDLFANAPENQRQLANAAKEIGDELGLTFKDPGIKGKDRTAEKVAQGKEPGHIADVVRGGFELNTPEQGDQIVAHLAKRFEIIDEGWFTTPVGYFDRKVIVRFPDGQMGEFQLWEPSLLKAKKQGHKLYEQARSLPPGDPRIAELNAQQEALYRPLAAALSSDWRAAVGNAGNDGNILPKSAGLSTLASSPTTAELTGIQAPLVKDQAAPLVQSVASPSHEHVSTPAGTANASASLTATGTTSVSDIGSNALGRNGDAQAIALLGKQVEKIAPHQVTDASGRSIDVAPIVVEARDLRTSADEGFDSALQPRNRDRAASQAQIRDIAGKLDPQRLGYSAEADRGAPIIGADGSVESGNGRVMALRAVYEDNGPAAERYRKWLSEQGVDVSGYDQPVLVRQRLTELAPSERQAFTLAANESSTLALSASERAMADARLLPVDTLDLIRNADDLGAAANRDFVRAFVAKLPQTEQGAIVDAHGAISSAGLTRIRNAVLARAYGDSAIIARVAEATSDEIKSISNALVSAAPEWAKLRAEISSGLVRADVDMTDELLEAVKRTADLRSKGTKLAEHLAQQDAFDRLPEPVEAWMRMFYDPSGRRAAGAPKIAERLRFYAEEARKASNDVGLGFGLAPVEARDIQALAAQKGQPNGKEAEGQGVFLRRRPGNGPGDEAGRGYGPADRPGGSGGSSREPSGAVRDAGAPGTAGVGVERPANVTVEPGQEFAFVRNPNSGAAAVRKGTDDFAQSIEPTGRYLTAHDPAGKVPDGWETGRARFENPLYIPWGESGDYKAPDNWKQVLAAKYGKKGDELSQAIRDDGFDGIVTFDKYGSSEIVDLTHLKPAAEPELNLRVKRQTVPNQIIGARPVEDQGTTGGRVQRLEDLARGIVEAVHVTAREGRVTPGALGQFSQRTGNIRVRSIRDLDTVLHEAGHALHLDPENKAKIDPLLKAFADELEPLGAKDGPKGRAEAFAELFRLYAVNRAYAEREFPNATAALDGALKQHFPEQAKALDELRANLDAIHNAPSGELVTADTINVPPPGRVEKLKQFLKADVDPSGRTVYSWLDAAYTSAIDKLHPIYRAVGALTRIAKENGKKVDLLPADDAYLLARNAPGAHGGATVMLKHGVIPAGGYQPTGPSMADAIEKAIGRKWKEADFNDFGAYLVARRMVQEYARYFRGEIPNPPGKFSVADYKSAVAAFEGKYPSFADAAQDLYAFQTNHLQRIFDKGLVSKAYFDAAMSRADYVPFVRDMADFADNAASLPKAGGGAGGIMRMSVMKKFGGSDRAVVNPLESIFKKVHDLETVIARNDIVNALDRLAADAGPGAGYIAERIPSNQLVGQKADVIDALKSAGKSAGVDKVDLEALILQAEDVLGDSTMATLFRNQPIMSEGGEPIIYGWRGGERYALRLGDGRLGRELYRSMTVMHDVERNVFFMALQISQMALRNGVVKAPDFILSNIIRDQQTALVAGGRKYIPFLSALRGLGDIITGSDVAKAYAGSGGMSAGAITEAIEHSGFGKNVHALNHKGVLSTLGKVFEASEAGTRIGLYRSYFTQAEQMGFDAYNAHLYAVFKSQDYIDFRRGGADMDRLRRWVPFLNAAVQGTDREVRALADLPVLEAKRIRGEELSTIEQDRLKDARVALVRTMAFGAVLGTGVAVMNHDDPDYQSAAKYTRNTNWLIKVGSNTWAAIPKPYGIVQAIANAFERASEYAFRKDPALFTEWAAASAESMLPPSQNPLVSVLYDVPANYDRFRERAIVPDYLQKVAPAEQYRPDTSEFAKVLGQLTNWSPLKIEYAMRNLGASGALDLLKVGDLLMGKEKPEKQIYDWPVLRRFMKNLERGSAATTAFYGLVGDKAGSLEQAKMAYQTKVRAGERLEAEKYLNGLPDDEKVWTTMSIFADAKEKRLHPMMNARDQVQVGNGLIGQLSSNNVVREDDLDRQDLTSSRRAAKPLQLTASSRSQATEDLQELNMIAARNAMVTVGAKGTVGLPVLDPGPALERLKMHAPDVAAEYQARLEIHHVYDPETVRAAWPEMKQRFLRDGENADVHDLAPRERKHRKQRRELDTTE